MRRSALAAAVGGVRSSVLGARLRRGAHPLGNFSVNHLDTLTFTRRPGDRRRRHRHRRDPHRAGRCGVDTDGDGTASPAELAVVRHRPLRRLRSAVVARPSTAPRSRCRSTSSSFAYDAGQAGLTTSRLDLPTRGRRRPHGAHRVELRGPLPARPRRLARDQRRRRRRPLDRLAGPGRPASPTG